LTPEQQSSIPSGMNAAAATTDGDAKSGGALPLAERLALARTVLETPRFRALCFWNWPKEFEVSEETLPDIAGALQLHGGREGFKLGGRICPTPQSRRRYFPRAT
jgi:hypothetical protein